MNTEENSCDVLSPRELEGPSSITTSASYSTGVRGLTSGPAVSGQQGAGMVQPQTSHAGSFHCLPDIPLGLTQHLSSEGRAGHVTNTS